MNDMRLSTALAASALGARRTGPDTPFVGCAVDSRKVQPGQLFAALRGEHTDGHDFVAAAVDSGAAAVLVSRMVHTQAPSIVVPDVHAALGALAGWWRQRMPVEVAAVTGSNGKTTVKELLGAILSQSAPTLVTAGNLNNDIGLPVTLLGLEFGHRYGVIEMGANHAGEIAHLATLARPRLGVITHCGPAHLEGFESLDGVARAKGELVEALPADGVAVLNADDAYFPFWRELAGDRDIVSFGVTHQADVSALWDQGDAGLTLQIRAGAARFDVSVAMLGEHNVMNVLAAVAAALKLGASETAIRAGLAAFRPVRGRLCPVASASGARLIDDSYNANPASLRAAVAVLAASQGRRWLVMGDMAELGADAEQMHRQAGREARESGIEHLITLGELSRAASDEFGAGGEHCPGMEALIERLNAGIGIGDTVLVKGSRSMAMERVVQALEQ